MAAPARAAPARIEHDRPSYLRDLWDRREFALYLATGKIKSQNASTTMGLFWFVLNPLLLAMVYFLVFGVIFASRASVEHYMSYLLAGIFAFYYTQRSLLEGANIILGNSKLLANLSFPRMILPIAGMIEAAVGFVASLVPFFILAATIDGVYPQLAILWLLPAVVLHTLFNLGLSTVAARMAIPFRDVNNLFPYLTRLWLYLSPVVYTVQQVPEHLRDFLRINPLVPFLELYRAALLDTPLATGSVLQAVAWALGIGALGIVTFVRSEGRMVRYL